MEDEIIRKIDEQNVKIDQIWRSVEKTRKYFLWTLIITVVTMVLPLIALAFAIPWMLKMITATIGSSL